MPEMYKEIHGEGEFELTRDERGITGSRTFIRDDTNGDVALASLPVVGTSTMVDENGSSISNCICRRMVLVFKSGVGAAVGRRYDYSTTDLSGGGRMGNAVPKDSAARSYSMGVEQITIETGTSDGKLNRFSFDGAASGREYVDQAITINILTGTIDIPNENQAMTQAELDEFISTQAGYAKSINNAAFEGYAEGQVRYDGFSGGEYYTSEGDLRYAVELHFSVRLIGDNLAGTAITSDDWLYELNEKEGLFRKLKNHNTNKYMYEKKDFSVLLDPPVP